MSLLERRADGVWVTRAWEGRLVVCIASGPSVTKEQLELVRQARERDAIRVAVVNDMYLVCPWADVCYFADARWHNWHLAGLPKSWGWASFTKEQVREAWKGFRGQKASIQHPDAVKLADVFVLKNYGADGLSTKADGIHTGSNSGYQLLNLVVLGGGNPIALVGYDMRFAGTRSHSHNGHDLKMPEQAYKDFAKRFTSLQRPLEALGVKVLNCTPGSAITAFPTADLAGLLHAA